MVNGSNAISRAMMRRMNRDGLSKVKLLDFKPFRGAVSHLTHTIESTEIEKVQILNSAALNHGLEGSENVIYFTHDYFSMAHDKNDVLKATARAAKENGVKRLIAVCPMEYDLYYSEEGVDPIEERTKAEEEAFNIFP